MAHATDYYRFMDPSVYRSSPVSPIAYGQMHAARSPRLSPNPIRNELVRSSYFDDPIDHRFRSSAPYHRNGFYGDFGFGTEERIRRYNREAAVRNASIPRASGHALLYPMMTLDGRFPSAFAEERRLEEFLYMHEWELERILMAYDLGPGRSRYYAGDFDHRFSDDDFFFPTRKERLPTATLDEKKDADPYDAIKPMQGDEDWATTPPIKLRPFKPKYHMTMALENIEMSDLAQVDSTLKDRLQLRRSLLSEHPEATTQCNKVAGSATLELYQWMVSTYLPKRFPSIYKWDGTGLFNTVTHSRMPLNPTSPRAALASLGENVDTDFLILLPSSTAADGSPIYHLESFVTCFPAGFSTREKCGNPLATIHAPVPGYAAKLERSMDRFFARLESGRIVRRANWSVTTNDRLFTEGGHHMYADEGGHGEKKEGKPVGNAKTLDVGSPNLEQEIERQRSEVVVEDCRLRCERQTLHRLPNTQALVFAFKTYLYTLEEVKDEGLGPELAEAIDGLGKGNVPAINFYKRGVVWGDKVKEFLRS
ncbi:hypothetical protein KC318_g9215 [Hortaea werneckii]|nr:hypothetical protein KC334_g9407 [Hortaea werneckii]KAI7003620.1 hypothetical protein KC355_g9123 [Hortaea werneckii]KAI7661839.1 hypothetical protein KC318_g9215 [Hortaea werneckii]